MTMIERFIKVQENSYGVALEEIRAGRKRSHWMWFIFPQIHGLGQSFTSIFYAIKSIEEAGEFLAHPLLGRRLREITGALLELPTDDASYVFGAPDDMKLRSCMTLFDVVEPNSVFAAVLSKFFNGEKDGMTLKILAEDRAKKESEAKPADIVHEEPVFSDRRSLVVIGAICGDIIGSWYEFCPTKSRDFELFAGRSKRTDDTICSIAIADALLNGNRFTDKLIHWCRKYPGVDYGGRFQWWFMQTDPQPYNSWGNGSAMRVSPVGAFARTESEVLDLAAASAEVTHNHPEGIKGAQATALAIFMALNDCTKDEIKQRIESLFDYDLSRSYAEIQPGYSFDVSCQGSVPESIIAFLESEDYESAIRMAVAYGGDADTQAAITGGIAAAYYGSIPDHILTECLNRLSLDMKEVIAKFNQEVARR